MGDGAEDAGCRMLDAGWGGLFDGPGAGAVGVALRKGGEESSAMFPKQRPDLIAIGLGDGELIQSRARDERERAFAMRRRELTDSRPDFEQEHEPVRLALITELADQSGEVQIGGLQNETCFLGGLATGARVRGFPEAFLQLAAGRRPQAAVRLLGSVQEEDLVGFVEAVQQRGDFMRQFRHAEKGTLNRAKEEG